MKNTSNKIKNKQVGLHQTKKLLYRKGDHQENEKTTYGMGEIICKWSDQQGINLQNIQTAQEAQYQKNKQPNQKNRQKI